VINQQHPITPPQELVKQWATECSGLPSIATEAAQWGADQELEKCCEWLIQRNDEISHGMRIARRPFLKPPSLKEQALSIINSTSSYLDDTAINTIRQALEALPNDNTAPTLTTTASGVDLLAYYAYPNSPRGYNQFRSVTGFL